MEDVLFVDDNTAGFITGRVLESLRRGDAGWDTVKSGVERAIEILLRSQDDQRHQARQRWLNQALDEGTRRN